jgi:5'-methylthioinosine phosphorylase
MPTPIDLAVIGGTGLYQLAALDQTERVAVATRWGEPSGPVVVGRIGATRVAFLARHGEAHSVAPHRVNYRANLWALRELGAKRVVGINAVGGITSRMSPRVMLVPDQVIDYTHGRYTSYCDAEGEAVVHIDLSEPYSASLRAGLLRAAAAESIAVVDGGVHGVTQGPRLETSAEVVRMARDGCDVVGMTSMPEAALARELGLEYACLAMVANWAAGCDEHGVGQRLAPISMDEIQAHLRAVTAQVPRLIRRLLQPVA